MSFATYVAGLSNVLGWWRLNEASGTSALDSSGNGRTLTIRGPGAVVRSVPGLLSDGSSDVATHIPANAGFDLAHATWMNVSPGMTLFALVNLDVLSTTAHQVIAAVDISGNNTELAWRFFSTSGKLMVYIGKASGGPALHQTAAAVFSASTTATVAFVHTGTQVTLYVNGVSVYTAAETALVTKTGRFQIGKFDGAGGVNAINGLQGVEDEVLWIGAALNAADVLALHNAATTPPSGVPTSVSSPSQTGTTLDLQWSAPSGGGSVTSYEARINGGAPVTTTSPHTFTGLTPGTSYTLEVRAVGPGGNSSYVSVTQSTVALPNVPTSVSVTDHDPTSLELSWSAPSGGGPVTSYQVRINGGLASTASSPHTFTGLTPSTMYTLEVRAVGGGGTSSYVSVSGTTDGPPDVPTDVAATATGPTEITLTWDPPGSGGAVDHYEIQIDDEGVIFSVGLAETYTWTGLTPATEYTVEVRAVSAGGESAWVSVTLETPSPPLVDVYLRLEVEAELPYPSIRGLLLNPDGEYGGAGWVTPTPGAIAGVPGGGLRFTSGGDSGEGVYFTSEAIPVTPGRILSVRISITALDGYVGAFINFGGPTISGTWAPFDYSYGDHWFIGAGVDPQHNPQNDLTGYESLGIEVPAGMTRARMVILHYADAGGTVWSSSGDEVTFGTAQAVCLTTGVNWSDVVDTIDWLDVLGPTHEISVTRAALDLGTLEATILDATLDPASAETLATGRACRLTALSAMTADWQPIFTGRIDQATVTYDTRKQAINPDDPKTARISLTAHDATTRLAASPRPDGYATVDELRAVLEGTGVPWNINGSDDQIAGAVIVARNENASAVDQIAVTRDSASAYAWLDRYGVLQAWNRDELVDGAAVVLNEDRYSDLSLSYDSEAFINSVVITYLTYDAATGETVETKYGPYLGTSVGTRGEKRAEFTVQGLVAPDVDPASAVADFAQAVLDANDVPVRTCESVTIPIRNSGEVTTSRAFLDMYRLTRVVNTARGFDEDLRVTGVTHQISADAKLRRAKWSATYTFAPLGSVASPQVTPPVPVLTPSGYTVPTFTNGWVNSSGRIGYRKLGGMVELRGSADSGTPGTQLFQLPDGFRPAIAENFVVATGQGPLRLDVGSDGSVLSFTTLAGFVSVSGVRFQADG